MHHPGNFRHSFLVVNKVLPHLDTNVRQAEFLGVVVDCEVLRGFSGIGLVVAHVIPGAAQAFKEYLARFLVLVPQNPHLPLARLAVQYRGETVNGDKSR